MSIRSFLLDLKKKVARLLRIRFPIKSLRVLMRQAIFSMILHLLWPAMPKVLSIGTIAACVVMMLISFVLYALRNVNHIRETKAE